MSPTVPSDPQLKLLQQMAADLQDIKDLLITFTGDGFPLKQAVPSSELLASFIIAGSLIAKEDPRIGEYDLQSRMEAAQVIGSRLIRLADQFHSQTQAYRLETLSHQPGAPGADTPTPGA